MTNRLPLAVIASFLGFPDTDFDLILDIGNTILAGLEDDAELRRDGRAAHEQSGGLLVGLLSARRDERRDDLILRIAHGEADGERLTDEEIHSFVSFLLVAGDPTTDMSIRDFWWALLDRPDEMELCRSDPARVDRAFSESLRRDGPIVYEDRLTTRPVEIHGRLIPQGALVLVCLGSANTDDSVFEEPEAFDPDRRDLLMGVERRSGFRDEEQAGHLAFGLGNHFCGFYAIGGGLVGWCWVIASTLSR